MREIIKNGVRIDDTFAEAFRCADGDHHHRAQSEMGAPGGDDVTGFATSVIGCGVEAGIDHEVAPEKPRTGVRASACCCFPCRPTCCRRSSSIAPANAC